MKYKDIWQKTLADDEKVEYEFSIGEQYLKVMFIIWTVISVLLLPLGGVGILVFAYIAFKYKFYLKVANAYALTNKRIIIHKGWLSTSTTSVDYGRITDVHVYEPFIDRVFTKTGNFAVSTAGTNSFEIVVHHVDNPYELKKKLDILKDK